MEVAGQFVGHGFAVAVGGGVATSIAVVLVALVTLINPERIYNDLLAPSLVALWLSQLIVFAAHPGSSAGSTTACSPPGR